MWFVCALPLLYCPFFRVCSDDLNSFPSGTHFLHLSADRLDLRDLQIRQLDHLLNGAAHLGKKFILEPSLVNFKVKFYFFNAYCFLNFIPWVLVCSPKMHFSARKCIFQPKNAIFDVCLKKYILIFQPQNPFSTPDMHLMFNVS